MEMRPQFIYTNKEGTINLTFTLGNQILERGKLLEGALSEIKAVFKRMQPTTRFIEETVVNNANEIPIGYLDFIISVLDADVYHFYFLFHVRMEAVLGIFNCDAQNYKEWKKALSQIMDTIKLGEVYEVKNNEN